MKVEVSLGEVVDKVIILDLKLQFLADGTARANVRRERDAILAAWAAEGLPAMTELAPWPELQDVNARLWAVEDDLRDHERRGAFDGAFVDKARSVYHLNDRRARLKRAINEALGSRLIEEKSYADYARTDGG